MIWASCGDVEEVGGSMEEVGGSRATQSGVVVCLK
jgi:hypothetical protein